MFMIVNGHIILIIEKICPIILPEKSYFEQVLPKRTNVPGFKQYRPRRFNPFLGYRVRRPYVPSYLYSPYGYGIEWETYASLIEDECTFNIWHSINIIEMDILILI
ncbi:hypothetical protein IEQ34_011189 [Dendrobium chrysotoxum]|uniref:Uncharacterized protein n=1 Tax=Dendrobium chrysotoxum TaxID=161865 RepID=A0AAV7GV14_DENCH|nr:hypothetical protein IEQ34_011189 [Dendrobium chrysotoxum]